MITIQLVTERGWQSAAIRYFSRSAFSHVDLVLPDGNLLGARLEGGVQVRKPDYAVFTKKAQYVSTKMTPIAEKVLLDFAHDQIGKEYDKFGIANFFLQRKDSSDWRNRESWFCSELVAAAFEAAGYPLLRIDSCDRVTPRDLTTSLRLKRIS